ncbi:response regulator transcription factor [Bacillus massiliigorillae]|uniref:response regulator transcription factor n=1 Tax=Bacillus massiliigorillae TaxID=1243664 RepID=UPI001E58D156|nr:response regulator transcription factor [Bacillus massiliigorillae]
MSNVDVFIIEDDQALCREISIALTKWGYQVTEVNDFEHITKEVLEAHPRLILMDVNLPSFDGFYWCQNIRKFLKVPILFISSRDSDMDLILSVNVGGDDYLTKPFSPQVLVAKVQAILRRTYSYNTDVSLDVIQCGDVILHMAKGKIYYKQEQLELTKNEFKILHILLKKQGTIVKREKIIEELWDTDEFISENTLTVNMNRLRKKLEQIGIIDWIITKKAQGYMII